MVTSICTPRVANKKAANLNQELLTIHFIDSNQVTMVILKDRAYCYNYFAENLLLPSKLTNKKFPSKKELMQSQTGDTKDASTLWVCFSGCNCIW